jgi:hypothetical protein
MQDANNEVLYDDYGEEALAQRLANNFSVRKVDEDEELMPPKASGQILKAFNPTVCNAEQKDMEDMVRNLPRRPDQWKEAPKLSARAYYTMGEHFKKKDAIGSLHDIQEWLCQAVRLFDESLFLVDEAFPKIRTDQHLDVLEAMGETRGALCSLLNHISNEKMRIAHPTVYKALPKARRLLRNDDETFELFGQEQVASAKANGAYLPALPKDGKFTQRGRHNNRGRGGQHRQGGYQRAPGLPQQLPQAPENIPQPPPAAGQGNGGRGGYQRRRRGQ